MVEWKEMWQVTTWDKKFSGVDKAMQPKVIKYHYYLANELSELERQNGDIRILYTTDKIAFADSADVDGNISEGEVVAIPWGGNVTIKYYKGKFVTADNRIATSNNTNYLNNKFLYYWMLSQTDLISSFYRGAGIQHPSMYKVLTMPVPIPSLSEQTRIVGILDTFTASIDNLKEQIAQRRKQYEYYRDQLLDLEGKEGVEMKTLGEVCEIKGDYGLSVPSKPFDGVRYLRITGITDMGWLNDDAVSADLKEECNKEPLVDGDILFARTGATVGKTLVYRNEFGKCFFAGYLIRYRLNKSIVSPQFMFHFTHSTKYYNWVQSSLATGAQPNISAQRYNVLTFPVPSISEQQRIVSILDTFEASIQNLEAQLKQREKQYEYYRNKLLTFE